MGSKYGVISKTTFTGSLGGKEENDVKRRCKICKTGNGMMPVINNLTVSWEKLPEGWIARRFWRNSEGEKTYKREDAKNPSEGGQIEYHHAVKDKTQSKTHKESSPCEQMSLPVVWPS